MSGPQSHTSLPHFDIPHPDAGCLNVDEDLIWTAGWHGQIDEFELIEAAKGGNSDGLHRLSFVSQGFDEARTNALRGTRHDTHLWGFSHALHQPHLNQHILRATPY